MIFLILTFYMSLYICHFKVKFNVEKYAAIQSFKLHKFEKEWDVLKNILE